MIEYGIAIAEARQAGERHNRAVSFVKEALEVEKTNGFQDPPPGTEPVQRIRRKVGPIERGVLTSINHALGETPLDQMSGAVVLVAVLKHAKTIGLVDQDPTPDTTGRWGELGKRLPGLKDVMVRARSEFEAGRGVPLDLEAARTAPEPTSASKE